MIGSTELARAVSRRAGAQAPELACQVQNLVRQTTRAVYPGDTAGARATIRRRATAAQSRLARRAPEPLDRIRP